MPILTRFVDVVHFQGFSMSVEIVLKIEAKSISILEDKFNCDKLFVISIIHYSAFTPF